MLESITLNFTDSPALTLPATGITVFVGPNNSGKSLVLREIETALQTHPFPTGLLILADYDVKWMSIEAADAFLEKAKAPSQVQQPQGQIQVARLNPNGGLETGVVNRDALVSIISGRSDKRWYATQFLRYGVLRLDGRSRFNLTNDQHAGDLLAPAQNVLGKLFREDDSRESARKLIRDAFQLTLVIDPTNVGQLRLRLSKDEALENEQSLDQAAREFHNAATYIKDASDGVQAYTGIVCSVVSGEYHTILIDEPEAFLHPPLARLLGRQLAELANKRGGSLLASTHSADFLMGCVQGSTDVRVVRLEYHNGKSRGRLVNPVKLRSLFQNPLMRSANATSALFYDGVVITESDNDRAFYAEIYHRISQDDPTVPSVLFVNAQNKQTIKDIMGPLRQFGVPAAAIADIDIIKDGGSVWTDWLGASQVPTMLNESLQNQRNAIKQSFATAEIDMKRDGGVNALPADAKQAANHLLDNLDLYGVFVVRNGELENWLADLAVGGRKTDWTVAMLQRLGSDSADADYVRPGKGDVWAFLRQILAWISDAHRKGTA